jgi:hypothetical protein
MKRARYAHKHFPGEVSGRNRFGNIIAVLELHGDLSGHRIIEHRERFSFFVRKVDSWLKRLRGTGFPKMGPLQDRGEGYSC